MRAAIWASPPRGSRSQTFHVETKGLDPTAGRPGAHQFTLGEPRLVALHKFHQFVFLAIVGNQRHPFQFHDVKVHLGNEAHVTMPLSVCGHHAVAPRTERLTF